MVEAVNLGISKGRKSGHTVSTQRKPLSGKCLDPQKRLVGATTFQVPPACQPLAVGCDLHWCAVRWKCMRPPKCLQELSFSVRLRSACKLQVPCILVTWGREVYQASVTKPSCIPSTRNVWALGVKKTNKHMHSHTSVCVCGHHSVRFQLWERLGSSEQIA